MLNVLIVFSSSLLLLMLYGLQSKNVNQSRYVAAGFTAACIMVFQIIFTRLAVSGTVSEILAMITGGVIGTLISIYIHDRLTARKSKIDKQVRGFLAR